MNGLCGRLAVVSLLIALCAIPVSIIGYRPEGTSSSIINSVIPMLSQQYPPYTIANYTVPTSNSVPDAIVAGGNHKIWFTEYGAGRIGEFDEVIKNFTD